LPVKPKPPISLRSAVEDVFPASPTSPEYRRGPGVGKSAAASLGLPARSRPLVLVVVGKGGPHAPGSRGVVAGRDRKPLPLFTSDGVDLRRHPPLGPADQTRRHRPREKLTAQRGCAEKLAKGRVGLGSGFGGRPQGRLMGRGEGRPRSAGLDGGDYKPCRSRPFLKLAGTWAGYRCFTA